MDQKPTLLDAVDDPTVTDPLTEVTRRERKGLLTASGVGLVLSAGGLVPQQIEAVGLTITPQEQSLLYIIGGIIGYFLVAFSVYAWADLKRRETRALLLRERVRPVVDEAMTAYKKTDAQLKRGKPSDVEGVLKDPTFLRVAALSEHAKFSQRVQRVAAIRIIVDIYLPVVVGVTSMIAVWSSTDGFPGWKWIGVGALATSLTVGALLLWWRWSHIYKWWRKWQRQRRDRLQKALVAQANALPPDNPKRQDLLTRARDLLMKSLKDFEDGIF
jgi:hypothetical protein